MTASAVKQTMIMLSDAVTSLMLLVVPLQESNAPMDQGLPKKTQAVAQISNNISAVADSLAHEEYDAFPAIQKEMLDASADVREQIGGLDRAIAELRNGNNRKQGWETLVSACTAISTKTVLLLKIVYGVEIKRVMAAARKALAKVNAVNTADVNTNPQKFVNDLQDAASELGQLGQYIAAKAEDPDLSPEVQDQLRRAAEWQQQASEDLIRNGNDLLQDRNNPEKKKKVEDTLDDARNAIAAANRPIGTLDEQLQNLLGEEYEPKRPESGETHEYDPNELAKNIARAKEILEKLKDPNLSDEEKERLLKELEELEAKIRRDAAAAGKMLEKTDPEKARAINDLLDQISREVPLIRQNMRDGKDIADSLARLLAGLDQLANMVAPDAEKQLVAVELMKKDLEDLERAEERGDGKEATNLARKVMDRQREIEDSPFRDDVHGEKQKKNVKDLGEDVPKNIAKLRDALNAPSPVRRDEFQKANEVVKSDANQVGAYAKNRGAEGLDDLLDQIEEGVRDAVEADKDGDKARLQEKSAMVMGARSKAHPSVARSAKASTDPARRRNEVQKWKDLSDCIDDLMGSMDKGADDFEVEKKRDKVLDAIEDYREAAAVDPLAAAEDLRQHEADYVAATVKGDRDRIPKEAKFSQEAFDNLKPAAKKAALRSGDPDIVDRVNGDLDRLERLMSQMVELGKRNLEAQNNRDEPAALQTAKDLNKKYDELDDVLDDLTSAIKPGVGQKHPHGPQSVDKDIPPHLRRLFAAAKDLERKLPPVVRSGEDAKRNPGEAEKKDFAKALEEIEIPMRGVKAHDSDENKIIALTKVLGDHVDDMGDAAREGNPNGVVSGARQGSDTKGVLGPALEELASREQDPKKREKIRALNEELEKLFPKTVVASKNVLQNPQDKQARDDLERAQGKMDDLLRNIRSTVGETPEEKCLSTKEDLDRALEALLGNVKRNDKKGTVHQARKVAGADLDPLKQMAEGRENERDLLDALDRLSDLLRDLEYQAPKAVETPAGSQQRKEVEDSVREAQNLLDKVAGDSGAAALGAIQKEQKSLRNLHDDLEGDDPANDLKRDIKDVVGDHRDVLEKLKEIEPKVAKDPKRSKELGEAIEEMESLMPELISKTKGVIVNPDDHAAQRELEEAVATVEVPLAKGANAVAPCALNELKARAREVDRAGQGVAAGTMSGDMQKAKKNSDKLDNLEPLKDCVEKRAKEMEKNDPVLARKMRDAMKEVEEASKEVQRNQKDPSKVGEKADKLSRCLRDLEELAEGSDINQDIALAAAQKDDLLRALKGPLSGVGKLDMGSLLDMARDLSDTLGGMVGKVEDDVKRRGGGDDALSALDRLRELERAAAAPIKPREEKKPEPKKEEKKMEPKKEKRAAPVAPSANAEFHERVKHVAEVIDVAADEAEDAELMSSAQGLSSTLIKLAEAAQKGDRMGILKNTKDAVAEINKLVLVFKEIAEQITDRRMKDRMVWLSSMMKDVGTNLKILCSVKAASGGPDNDDQIVSVITSVKNIFTEGLDLANITERTNKRRK